jgi:MerR family mercuric resistance operon transcriptional regulator
LNRNLRFRPRGPTSNRRFSHENPFVEKVAKLSAYTGRGLQAIISVLKYGLVNATMYTISQLAKSAGVNVETIRYYERQNLIEQPNKPPQGYRQYPEDTLTKVLFIKRAQHLGFTLAEIHALIELSTGSCHEVQHLAEHKLDIVQAKIKDLKRLENSLKQLVTSCQSNPDTASCPVIDALVPVGRRLS